MKAIIYPAGLGLQIINKPRWQNHKMEEWRRFLLAYRIGSRARICVIVLDHTSKWLIIPLFITTWLRKLLTTRLHFSGRATQSMFTRITGGALNQSQNDLDWLVEMKTPRFDYKQRGENIVQIVGVMHGESGLARNTPMSAEAFGLANIPIDLSLGQFDRTGAKVVAASVRKLRQSITLHHINADRIPPQILSAGPSMHIGYLLWELKQVPSSHLLAGKLLDEVWVPSTYVQNIYKNIYGCKAVNIRKGLSLPEVVATDLAEYGINADHQVFLMCFDAHSSVEWKNPLAAVHAFVAAFPNDQNVRLLIKTTPVSPAHWGDPNKQMQKIKAIARFDSRVIVDERMLSFTKLLSLIKRADCIVSPHRAEGFGYIPAYALWYGRLVISTNYSGTRDICDGNTAYPIPYKLIDIGAGESITLMKNAEWADIDVQALSLTLCAINDDPMSAKIKALCGQKLLGSEYTIEMQAKRCLNRFRELGPIAE